VQHNPELRCGHREWFTGSRKEKKMTKYVNISGPVTKRTHEKVLTDLLEQFEQWRESMGWCTDLYKYVQQLSDSYHWNPDVTGFYRNYDGQMTVAPRADMTDEERGQDLRDVRGRVLMFTLDQSDMITLDKANEFLTAARLASWNQGEPGTRLVYASVGVYVNTTKTDEQISTALRNAATRLGEVSHNGPDLYVNEQSRRGRSIPVTDESLVPLLPRPRYL